MQFSLERCFSSRVSSGSHLGASSKAVRKARLPTGSLWRYEIDSELHCVTLTAVEVCIQQNIEVTIVYRIFNVRPVRKFKSLHTDVCKVKSVKSLGARSRWRNN